MNNAIKKMLERYSCKTSEETLHALREILQEVALLGLWRSKFFEHAAFYGGTALRILYGLDRFSEDLDFSLLVPDATFELSRYLPALESELAGFGFRVEGKIQQKSVETAVQSAFLKAHTLHVMLEFEIDTTVTKGINPGQLLKIKLEVDTDPPAGFISEAKYLLQPIPFAVRTYSLPDLFAGKVHALLFRKWKNRVKGRDWYDFVWYCAYHPQLHVSHLQERMRQSGHWSNERLSFDDVRDSLRDAIENLDVNQARQDVRPFIREPETLDIWSTDFFMSLVDRIEMKK
ncbi:MAG: nucleotidyl transferase, PF08843 family protein [Desulfobulbaceae bacterium BRH_c16a]|nr:MAG: nucleotidyl transferase, PF08843 family protein [Desulfobulbaceae bacterium BRH_c16a]